MSPLPDPVHLRTSTASGAIHAHGAHVTSWIPSGGDEVLFLSRAAVYDSAAAIRGGIPVIFPWFGPGRTSGMTPAHGFARTSPWRLASVDETAESRIAYRLDHTMATSPWFPGPYAAELTASFGRCLEVTLSVTNTGTDAVSYEDALHAYFRVGDVTQARIEGLDTCEYLDKTLDAQAPPQVQRGDLEIDGVTDRIYACTGVTRIVDPVLGRTITIEKSGSSRTVVWNPWSGNTLADLAPGEWREFVCVETANARDGAVQLASGETHSTHMRVSVAPIA